MVRPDLKAAFDELKRKALEYDVELDDSFFGELQNYSGHQGVVDLSEEDLHRVIERIGEHALRQCVARRAGGKSVRETLLELCPDPFSTCFEAAQRILGVRRPLAGA